MLAVALALIAATTFGASDFFGGLSSRRAPVPLVLLYSHLASLLPLLAALWLLPAAHPVAADYGWGAAAGAIAVAGMILLYLGLATGPMTLVAPVTAVCVAVLPAGVGLALGERLSGLAWAGLVLGVSGAGLVSLARGAGPEQARKGSTPQAVALSVGAGACLGAFFIVLSRTSSGSGLAPLIATRAVTLAAFGAVAGWRVLRSGALRSAALPRRAVATAVAAGVLDMTGNAFYLLAVRSGPLAVVAVLTALYPAATVLLARAALGERMSLTQGIGTGAAIAAVGMLALSRA